MHKTVFLLLSLVASVVGVEAQNISGKVVDERGAAVSYVTVALLEASDSSFVTGVIAGDDGSFTMAGQADNRLVKVSGVGYRTVILSAATDMSILLHPSEQSMKEVTVTTSRPVFKMKEGQFVSHIQGTVFSQLGKAVNVLQQLPMMSSDGTTVLGKGTPLVYINNRRMRDWNELDRIASDMIKDIRIDMNPGAKYSSEVRAVIFITTVKPVGKGLGGEIGLQESASDYWNNRGWLNLNYRRKGLDVFLSSSLNAFSNSRYRREDAYAFEYNGKDVDASYDGDGYESSKSGYVSVGFNELITPKQSVGATYALTRVFSSNASQEYQNRLSMGADVSDFATGIHAFSHSSNHNIGVYYENVFSDHLSLNVDGSYAHYANYNRQSIVDTREEDNSTLTPVSRSSADMGAVKTVVASSLAGGKLEYGFETTFTRYRQKYDVEPGGNDVLRNSDNLSRQSALDVFVNYSRNFGKVYTQAGIKYEYANYDYYVGSQHLDESSRNYHHVLPSLSVSYDIGRLSLMLSYNIYTVRPSYGQLDEGLQYVSSFRYNRGNSKLKAAYDHDVSLTASYGNLQLTCDYTYSRDAAMTWFDVLEAVPAIVSTEENHTFSSLYASVAYSPTLFRIWKSSWNVWMNKQWLTYGGLSYNRPQYGLLWKNIITLLKEWAVIVNASGNLKGNANTYMAYASMRVDVALQKVMKSWWLRAGVTNVCNAKEKGYSQYANVFTSHYVNNYNPVFYLTFSYSFNPSKSKYKGKTAGQSELNRM